MARKSDEQALLRIFAQLSDDDRRTVLEFARFLAMRPPPGQQVDSLAPPEPEPIPRPPGETVIGAMKRLSKSYHMLDKAKILNETSILMAQHVMQGRDANEVIEDLEALFESHYRRLGENER